jgi:hypothetical protein
VACNRCIRLTFSDALRRQQEASTRFMWTTMTRRGSTRTTGTRAALIAPCGMNCRLCRAYAREQMPCPGCRSDDGVKLKTRISCRIKNCSKFERPGIKFCFSCDEFPCEPLEHLDKRYRSKYGMSMIENLSNIKKFGIRWFVRSENKKWRCLQCGEMLCVHKPQCLSCGKTWHRIDKLMERAVGEGRQPSRRAI